MYARCAAIGSATLTAIADRGYFKGEEILACREAGIAPLVPATTTSNAKAEGRFVLDEMQARLEQHPDAMRIRSPLSNIHMARSSP